MLHRAICTAAMVAVFGTGTVAAAGIAHAGPPGPAGPATPADDGQDCREYAQVAHPFVQVQAEDDRFDTNCLSAPANRSFRIYLKNNDADPHNISIYSADPAVDKRAEQLFKGKPVKGPGQEEYAVDALPPGKYFFQDDKTKTMNGAIEVAKK
ncbi:MAG TPA: cupredoxin domain-containing protein [Acidimicrobiia bacterium]|nr:cupredoxin domain-containing protein [Acidimicrobiia bacterium]